MAGGIDEGDGGAISGINVTPLVDVMLVLLVIFMVTTPMIQQGVNVNLPNATGAPLAGEEMSMVVSVTVDGQVYLNDTKYELAALTDKILAIAAEKPNHIIYLRADHDASYGTVVGVIAALKSAGITKLGMITEPQDA
jgi:biopolymer transport protein TolR